MMMQRTFGPTVGLDSEVPVAGHPSDLLVCHDTGEDMNRRDCLFAADGTPFADSDERIEYDIKLVHDILESHIEWDDEYRKSPDCTSEYHHIVGEDSTTLMENLVYWADDYLDSDSTDYPEEMREAVCADILETMEVSICEGYSPVGEPDVIAGSWECGETEIEVIIAENDVLAALADRGDLEVILESLDCEFCIGSVRKPVRKNGAIVSWKHDCYISVGCITLINNTDIRYVFGLSNEAMEELWDEHADKTDCRLYQVHDEVTGGDKFVAEIFYGVDGFYDDEHHCEIVVKRRKSSYAIFVPHHDYPSESFHYHLRLMFGLEAIKDRAEPGSPASNTVIAEWVGEALADAMIDIRSRYPERYEDEE